jgi:hypothetical protein
MQRCDEESARALLEHRRKSALKDWYWDDKYDGPTTRIDLPVSYLLIAQVGDLPALAILKSN